jgi:Alpha/beta hydrolase family
MNWVTSKDGTTIAYERVGRGPAVILVGGGLDDGAENAPLAAELAGRFTVYNYARRGRGGSGDTQPYAVEREIEDIDALIAEADGSAHMFGASSGGALALEAELVLGDPAGRVPDLGGPHVSTWDDMLRVYLRARHRRRLIVPVRIPGTGRVRAGGLLPTQPAGAQAAGAQATGRRTWEEFLADNSRPVGIE